MIENSTPPGSLPGVRDSAASEPLEPGGWLTLTLDALPAPWSGLPVEARLRLQPGKTFPADLLDERLPAALASVVSELQNQGESPPYILHPYSRVTLGGVFELGRLVVGDAIRSVNWTAEPRDFPLVPAQPLPFATALRPFDGVFVVEPAISLDRGAASTEPLTFDFPEIDWIAPYENLPATSLTVEMPGFDRYVDVPTRGDLLEFESQGAAPPEDSREEASTDKPHTIGPVDPLDEPSGRGPEQPPTTEPRVLQCTIGPDDPTQAPDNVLRTGRNLVGVFLGPQEVGALVGEAISDEELAFGEADYVVVQVQLTPLEPEVGVPSAGPLLVPRLGRTATLPLTWEIPAKAKKARAQLAVTRDGRVIAVAEITGKIGGVAQLVGRMSIGRPEADPPPVARAMLLSSDAEGTPALVVPSETRVELLPQLEALSENIRDALNQVINIPDSMSAKGKEAARNVLVSAARAGSDLYQELEPLLGDLTSADAVQIVTALAPHAMPLELLYVLPAPADDAVVCQTWLDGGDCRPDCVDDDGGTVCPAGFWGISRTVERHYRPERQGVAVLQVPSPDSGRPRLRLDVLAFAASQKVTDPTLKKAQFDPTQRVKNWDDWRGAVANGAGMLVLMPHTLPKPPSLEVSGKTLHRSQITKTYVTVNPEDAPPAVVLFGCDTGGQQADPVGYTTRFLGAGAGVVFGAFSLLRAGAAATLASRLVTALRDPARSGQPIGRILTEVRSQALHDGVWAGLAMTSYGDANWKV